MSYLENFIGKVITLQITEKAHEDRMVKIFFQTRKEGDFIGGILRGVDGLGIWLEAKTRFAGEQEDRTASVLIPFHFIVNICRIHSDDPVQKQMGFLVEAP